MVFLRWAVVPNALALVYQFLKPDEGGRSWVSAPSAYPWQLHGVALLVGLALALVVLLAFDAGYRTARYEDARIQDERDATRASEQLGPEREDSPP